MIEPLETPIGQRHAQPSSVEQLCDWFDQQIKRDYGLRCESWLAEYAEWFSEEEAALDLIYTEYNARCELGDAPEPAEFYARFPLWREQLEHQFELARMFNDSARLLTHQHWTLVNVCRSTSKPIPVIALEQPRRAIAC